MTIKGMKVENAANLSGILAEMLIISRGVGHSHSQPVSTERRHIQC